MNKRVGFNKATNSQGMELILLFTATNGWRRENEHCVLLVKKCAIYTNNID